jgi:hypothetical protein
MIDAITKSVVAEGPRSRRPGLPAGRVVRDGAFVREREREVPPRLPDAVEREAV